MNNRIPRTYQGVMHDLLQQHKGTGKRVELITEKGAYTMQASKSSGSFVIEITDDHETVEVEGVSSTEELRVAVQETVRETIECFLILIAIKSQRFIYMYKYYLK